MVLVVAPVVLVVFMILFYFCFIYCDLNITANLLVCLIIIVEVIGSISIIKYLVYLLCNSVNDDTVRMIMRVVATMLMGVVG